jgi:hypothetical protein
MPYQSGVLKHSLSSAGLIHGICPIARLQIRVYQLQQFLLVEHVELPP